MIIEGDAELLVGEHVSDGYVALSPQNAYDMAELQKSLQPSPAQSVQYSRCRGGHHPPAGQQDPGKSDSCCSSTLVRRDVPPARPPQAQAGPPGRRSLSFSSQDLARYLCEVIRDADQRPEAAPFDSLRVFATEGGGSPAGSLSSFGSAGPDEDRVQECLKEWGPRFEKLRALYERAESSDL